MLVPSLRNALHCSTARSLWRVRALPLHAHRALTTAAPAAKPDATAKKAAKAPAATKAASKNTEKAKKTAPAAKETVKKTAVKKKTAAKKKKTVAKKKPAAKKKAAPKKRVPKPLTEEQKNKALIAALRKAALKAPATQYAVSAYNVFISEQLSSPSGARAVSQANITKASKEFKELAPAQLEHYQRKAAEINAANQEAIRAWVNSHTTDEIRQANNARRRLRRMLAGVRKSGPAHTCPIADDRVPKRPTTPYLKFFITRYNAGVYNGLVPKEASKVASGEWKALSDAERQNYSDNYKEERIKYEAERPAKATS